MKDFIYQNKIWLGIIICLILIIIGSSITFIYYYFYLAEDCTVNDASNINSLEIIEEETVIEIEEETTDEINYIYIDIKGAVKNPGVYKVEENSIVNDVISLAGGLSSKAITSNINLSKIVTNEMVIYVFDEDDYMTTDVCEVESLTEEAVIDSSAKSEEIYIDEETENFESVIESSNESEVSTDNSSDTSLVNLNTASVDELMTLSGIGESKALAIISYREEQLFSSIEELTNVSGIGDSTLDAIKDFITV